MKINAYTKRHGKKIFLKKELSIFLIGVCTLILGWIVYAFLRPLTQVPFTYLFPKHLEYNFPLMENLPSFIHTLSFSLILSYFLNTKKQFFIAISLWGIISLSLEIIQHEEVCLYLEKIVNIYHYEIFNKIYWYSKTGVFDYYDILAIFSGIAVAILIEAISKRT